MASLAISPHEQFIVPSSQPVSHISDPRKNWPSLKTLNYPALNLAYTPQDIRQYCHLGQARDLNSNKSFSQPLVNIFSGPKNTAYQSGILGLQLKNNIGLCLSNLQELQNRLSSQIALQNRFLVQNHSLNNLKFVDWRNRAIFSQTGNPTVRGEPYN